MSNDVIDAKMQPLVNTEALLGRHAADMAARLQAPAGDRIKVGMNKQFTFPDDTSSAGPFEAVILDYQYMNVYYSKPFVKGKASAADCYANSATEQGLAPPDNVPSKQADTCAQCPMNQFKTHPSGNGGKACQNRVVLAITRPDAKEDSPIEVLDISPTAMAKSFVPYMRKVTVTAKRSPVELVTLVGFNPNSDYAQVAFEPATDIVDGKRTFRPNPDLAGSMALADEARGRLESEKPNTTG